MNELNGRFFPLPGSPPYPGYPLPSLSYANQPRALEPTQETRGETWPDTQSSHSSSRVSQSSPWRRPGPNPAPAGPNPAPFSKSWNQNLMSGGIFPPPHERRDRSNGRSNGHVGHSWDLSRLTLFGHSFWPDHGSSASILGCRAGCNVVSNSPLF